MNGSRRRFAVLGAAVALVVSACGSTVPASRSASQARSAGSEEAASLGESSGSAADQTAAAQPGSSKVGNNPRPGTATTAPANGTLRASPTGTRGPIELGVLYAVNDGAESAGINNGNSFALKDVVHAYVDSFNSTGGIAGRHIDAVYAELHSASNDYESQAQAACSSFTQDHHVAAVISNVGYHSEVLQSCLAKASVPIISGDWDAPDRQDASRYPLFITPTSLLGDTRVAAVVNHLTASGFLQSRNKIGVVVEDCPIDERVFQNSLVPALRSAGLTLAATYRPRCFLSLQSYGGQASDIQSAVLQFNRSGVDRVMFVSQAAEANIMNLFSTGADAQHYTPSYALSSIAAPAVLSLNAPKTQLANVQGVGWLPHLDTENIAQAPPTATAKRCLEQMKKQGLQPVSSADYTNVYGGCDSFGLYDALLRATNGDATSSAVIQALKTVGPSYVSASTVDGQVAMTDGRIGAARGRLFAFVGGTRFEYTSASFPL